MAVCELSGQMLVYQEEKYQDIDEEEIVTAMKSATLETFNLVFDSVTEIFKSWHLILILYKALGNVKYIFIFFLFLFGLLYIVVSYGMDTIFSSLISPR